MASAPFPGPCPPGYLPSWLYDQQELWIDDRGRSHLLEQLQLPELLEALSRCEQRAPEDWLYEIEVFLAFVRHARETGVDPELHELQRIMLLGAKGWLKEKRLFAALTAKANAILAR
jgi:hypothetical protein